MPRSMLMIWLLALTLSIAWIAWPNQIEHKQGALANVASIQGNVHIRSAGSFSWTSARVGSHLLALDAIATGPNSRAELQLENGDTIVLPEDTQIKVQAQTVIPGMTIALIKGGLEVQTEDIREIDKKVEAVKEKRKPAAKPITIQTNRYSVDLSRLEGQFRLQADAGAEASKPETVRVQNAKGAISLARLDESDSATVDQQLDESFQEAPPPPPIEVLPDVVPEPLPVPVPAPRVKKVEPIPEPEPEVLEVTPEPELLPPVVEPEESLVLPRLKDSQLSFWTVESIEESFEIPLVLPLGQPRAEFNPDRWQSILRISVRGSKKNIVVKREPGSLGMFFYLRELQSILPKKDLEGLSLVVESGLLRRGEEAEEIRVSDWKLGVSLQSLQNRQSVTLQLDGWRFVEPTDQWIRTPPLARSDIVMHLIEPLMLSEMEGYMRGAKSFAVQPLQAASQLAPVHFVRGKSIVATIDTTDDRYIKGLIKRLRPDLVYRGSFQAFLGGKGSFDLNKQSSRAGDLYYVRSNRVLKLDRNLFKTHSAARAFIRNFDPYFMGMQVDILYNKD